jgi:hypothetical protein
MAYTSVPTIVDGDDATDDWPQAVEAAIEELQVRYPETLASWAEPGWTGLNKGTTGTWTGSIVKEGAQVMAAGRVLFNGTGIALGDARLVLPYAAATTSVAPVGSALFDGVAPGVILRTTSVEGAVRAIRTDLAYAQYVVPSLAIPVAIGAGDTLDVFLSYLTTVNP